MLFRRHNPTPVALPVALIAPPTNEHTTQPSQYAFTPFTRTPKSLEEILSISTKLPATSTQVVQGLGKADSSHTRYSPEHRSRREPSSRKTGHATIHTEATDQHEAFESDAFAVHMPTTRLPIIDRPILQTRPSPAAQAEAYQTYKEKARQVRERNSSLGVRVPSKIVSYDYAIPDAAARRVPVAKETSLPLSSPAPAGSFPISPPLPQTGWARPERIHNADAHTRDTKVVSKPLPSGKAGGPSGGIPKPSVTYRKYGTDCEAGASRSTPSPTQTAPIRIRIKPRVLVTESQHVQIETKHSLYNRSPPIASPPTTRSPSPVKSMPNFTRHNSVEGDSLFGYRSKDLSGAVAGAGSSFGSDKDKEKEKDNVKIQEKARPLPPKRTLTSRWPWLRASGPRVAKPALPTIVMSNIAPKSSAYVDPFVRHASPPVPKPNFLRSPAARPASPRKSPCTTTPAPQVEFETGFAQIKQLAWLLCKAGIVVYAIFALWYILDAVREAVHTIGAPFRAMKFLGGFLWIGVIWFLQCAVRMWERLGFKITHEGGWIWKMR